ncbi:MAG: TonB family protein [Vicinamibacteria bacterium]|nr:TonB family protein [Vicinamibacteria bacterium]
MDQDFGRYEVIEEVGRGAMGVVYKGRDPFIGRTVAIKALNRAFLAQMEVGAEEYLERFRREAQVSGVLNHPNIVKVFDLGPDFMVMEFVEGQSLAAVIKSPNPPGAQRMLEIVASVADALDYAHRHGVVHRDIKPANIMVQTDGLVKVMDFGLARIGGSQLTAAGAVLGSASYMAPEVIMGRPADPRADIFSLGVTAYEALTGHRPFPGKSVSVIITSIIREPPKRIAEFGLPHEYDAIFEKVLSKEANDRYQTATEFSQALLGHEAPAASVARLAGLPEAGTGSMVVMDADELGGPPADAGARSGGTSGSTSGGGASSGRRSVGGTISGGRKAVPPPPLVVAPPPTPTPAPAPPAEDAESTVYLGADQAASALAEGAALADDVEVVEVVDDHPLADLAPPPPSPRPPVPPPPQDDEPATVDLRGGRPAVAPPPIDEDAPTVHVPRAAAVPAPPTPPAGSPVAPAPAPAPAPASGGNKGLLIGGLAALLAVAIGVGVVLTRKPAEPPPPTVKEGDLVPLSTDMTPPKYVSGDPVSVAPGASGVKLPAVVLVEFIVDEKGQTTDLRIAQSGGKTLDEACRKAVLTWRYEPAKKAGVKVKVQQSYQFNFKKN